MLIYVYFVCGIRTDFNYVQLFAFRFSVFCHNFVTEYSFTHTHTPTHTRAHTHTHTYTYRTDFKPQYFICFLFKQVGDVKHNTNEADERTNHTLSLLQKTQLKENQQQFLVIPTLSSKLLEIDTYCFEIYTAKMKT